VVGERVFQLESGIPSAWWMTVKDTHPTEVMPLLPSLMGAKDVEVVLGKGSGTDSLAFYLDKLGLSVPEERMMDLLVMVKEKAMEKKGLLTEDEFEALVGAL
jgi:isopropylmalate/homocitrate/citramalate synthase